MADGTRPSRSNGRERSTRRRFLAGTSVAAAAGVAGCNGLLGSSDESNTGPETVTFGTLTIPAVAEVLVAKDRGYFEERDIELEVERIQSAQRATPQLASGDLDTATGSVGAGLFNSMAQDVEISVVADQTQYWRGQPSSNKVLIRPEKYSEGMTLADVSEDFTIALHGKGNVDAYIWARLLQRNDMTWGDVRSREILYTNMTGAMSAGEIDAAAIPDPLGLGMVNETGAKRLLYASEVAPRMQIGVYLFGEPFMQDRPEVARRWLEAYLLGVREYYELGGFPSDEVASIVSEEFDLPKNLIKMSIPSLPHKNGRLNRESIMSQQAYHHCRGEVEEQAEESAIVDESLLEEALDDVGRLDDPEPAVETINEWGQTSPKPYSELETIDEPEGFPADPLCE
ncbi:ABC-type nitrate/sulfonate/bicarbonate transportsystem, periplasmic component [Halapricum desulfuricans]|uniref:ABC-type nitrate/sulfonate/bicarbonate transportsystem, periplasmic component n=1 Tax=Halapricum desulfuricans TaxID=2841257 RepID=A0A897NDR4_9EURY|nr:ABC transporter substrate-binding protein [Halapricum desulfuricans]QSG10554.1 ABC-type nitrate/sulfonate/bicarbonate transportsystem, periplasmic component [Halapricum desulfuricans]